MYIIFMNVKTVGANDSQFALKCNLIILMKIDNMYMITKKVALFCSCRKENYPSFI